MNEKNGCMGCLEKTGILVLSFMAICFVIGLIFSGDENINTTNTSETNKTEIKQIQQDNLDNQEEIKKIENYIKEFQKAGIFTKITDMGSDGEYKLLEIQVDEYAWNNLEYDIKKATENMFLRYWQIAKVTVLFRGYRTGQKLYTISKNFKI